MTCARCNGTRLIHELILPLGMPDPYTCPDCYVPPPPPPRCHACGQTLANACDHVWAPVHEPSGTYHQPSKAVCIRCGIESTPTSPPSNP